MALGVKRLLEEFQDSIETYDTKIEMIKKEIEKLEKMHSRQPEK